MRLLESSIFLELPSSSGENELERRWNGSRRAREEGRRRKFETLLRQKQCNAFVAKVRVTRCSFLKESIFVPFTAFLISPSLALPGPAPSSY